MTNNSKALLRAVGHLDKGTGLTIEPVNGYSPIVLVPEATKGKPFDYVIARHIIEYAPDPVRWLQDVASLLKPDGSLILAIHDIRYGSELNRQPSTPADAVAAYIEEVKRPCRRQILEFAINVRDHVEPQAVWSGNRYLDSRAPHRYSPTAALALSGASPSELPAIRCSAFTPASFFATIATLIELELFDYTIERFNETQPGQEEFIVKLKRADRHVSTYRKLQSVPQIARELHKSEYEALVASIRSDKEQAEHARNAYHSELQNILQSRSWRIGKPVRHAVRLAKKLRSRS